MLSEEEKLFIQSELTEEETLSLSDFENPIIGFEDFNIEELITQSYQEKEKKGELLVIIKNLTEDYLKDIPEELQKRVKLNLKNFEDMGELENLVELYIKKSYGFNHTVKNIIEYVDNRKNNIKIFINLFRKIFMGD